MDKFKNIIDMLSHERQLSLEEIPSIDLYMDQVIQLFENQSAETKRTPDEKVLTKTMINNYAKGKLLFPIKNKKYSKEHLILISLIYQLKGALSISDIKTVLSGINEKIEHDGLKLDVFYSSYLKLVDENTVAFTEAVHQQGESIEEEAAKLKATSDANLFQPVLMIASFVHMSNLYRRAAEKLVDQLNGQ